jgi:hypothetical protein
VSALSVCAVNGDGPTCGCGRRSALRVKDRHDDRRDYFLCRLCAIAATEAYLRATGQESQGRPLNDYTITLYSREHGNGWHDSRPRRWCPDCEAAA